MSALRHHPSQPSRIGRPSCWVLALNIGWLGCTRGGPPPAAPQLTIGAAVPLSGADVPAGDELVRGMRLAAGESFAVLVVDDVQPGAAARLADLPEVLGAVAHVREATAVGQLPDWSRVDVPVVFAAPGAYAGVPRVVPPAIDLAACAATLIGAGPYVVRTDGDPESLAAARVLEAALPDGFSGEVAIDGADIPMEAGRLQRTTATVVWLGDPTFGGNLLHAVRALGAAPFFAVSGAGPAFLGAAGGAAEGARVTGFGRPALDPVFRRDYEARYGVTPTGQAALGFDAARLLIAAWESANTRNPAVTRAAVREALATVQTSGSAGPTSLDERGVVQPVTCESWRVVKGELVPDLAGRAGAAPAPVAGQPPPASGVEPGDPETPAASAGGRRRKPPEGEWLGLKNGR